MEGREGEGGVEEEGGVEGEGGERRKRGVGEEGNEGGGRENSQKWHPSCKSP